MHPTANPRPAGLAGESIAGEEDPGASIERTDVPAPMAPVDPALPGMDAAGEDVCPQCGGCGQTDGASGSPPCPHGDGTGRVVKTVGGA